MLQYFSTFILEYLRVDEKSTIDSLKDIEKVHSLYISLASQTEYNNQNYSHFISLLCCILHKFKSAKTLSIYIYNTEYVTLYPILFRYIKEMRYLKKLDIGVSWEENQAISYGSIFFNMFSKLKNLESLSLSQIDNSASNQILDFSCSSLVSLSLCFNGDEDENFSVNLQNFSNLQTLCVQFNQIYFENEPSITIQNFEGTKLREFEAINHKNFTNLDRIILQKLEHITMGQTQSFEL
jgi:hypothetical protein